MKTKFYATLMSTLVLGSGLALAQISVTSVLTNGLAEPYNIVADSDNNFFISDSINNRIVRVDANTGEVSTLAGLAGELPGSEDGPPYLARFNNPQGLVLVTLGGVEGLLVSDTGNHTVRFVNLTDASVSTVAGVAGQPGNAAGGPGVSRLRYPIGLATDGGGFVYVADMGNHTIRVLDLTSSNLTTLAVAGTTFNQPTAVALGNPGDLWVADTRNHMVKLIALTAPESGSLQSVIGSGVAGSQASAYGPNAQLNGPRGLLWWPARSQLLISDTANHAILLATNYPVYGPTNWSVRTFAGTPPVSGSADGSALQAQFNNPVGLALDAEVNGFLIADLKNNAIRRLQDGPQLPAVSAPQIGWVDFVWNDAFGAYVTLLRTEQPKVFNNETFFAILREANTECHYTTTNITWPPGFSDDGLNPSKSVGSTPPEYQNGVPRSVFEQNPAIIPVERRAELGGLVIKAMGYQLGRPNSAVAKAYYAFKVAEPTILGNNLASFRVTSITTNPTPVLYYTVNGEDPTPTNAAKVPVGGQVQLNFPAGQTQVTFKVRGYADNYLPSSVVAKTFSRDGFIPNRITFGLTNGEPSSAFLARPGQYFYAPVTLQLQPEGETIYSLQFNVAVTNEPTSPAVPPGAGLDFFSMLVSDVEKERADHNPPPDFQWYLTIPPFLMGNISNQMGEAFFVNTNNNLLSVGWLYRPAFKYTVAATNGSGFWQYLLDYDTTKHDLIQYSIAHDTLFDKSGGVVVVGAYSFQVPSNASPGDQYFLQLGSPSATRDGVGAPGADVYIQPPSARQAVTVGSPAYLVGDVAPFRWLNAGDFGEGMLNNADVMQVFQSAILRLHVPPANSDLFRAMDSAGRRGVWDADNQYFTEGPPYDEDSLTDGYDTEINQVAFGDGDLDVRDVFVTFRRSLDPSLVWFTRYWTNSQFVAVTNASLAFNSNAPMAAPIPPPLAAQGGTPGAGASITLSAEDRLAAAGQSVYIPITGRITGPYPLRVLGLNLTVRALEGAPALTQPVEFIPAAGLGQPALAQSKHAGNFSAAWLGASPGLVSDALIGTLVVTLPVNAPATAAYAICFDHASASPNGVAIFPRRTRTGLITLMDRSTSSWGDGISDAWRLRHFGTLNNLLSAAQADADGDGHSNLAEFRAGTDPNDATSVLKAFSERREGQFAVRWPSEVDKTYIIERASALFGANWVEVHTAMGTGGEMEFHDPDTTGTPRFYRVRVAE